MNKIYENMRPLRNLGGRFRRLFDLQVASTYLCLKKVIYDLKISANDRVLDVGCGAMPYRNLFCEDCQYLGIDTFEAKDNFDYYQADVKYYDGVHFPVEDGVITVVLHSEVIEHIYNTKQFLSECYRVLKKKGKMVFTVPFQARFHYIPYDYWRFTPASLYQLLSEAGFKGIVIMERGSDVTVAGYKVLSVGYRLFLSKSWWKILLSIILAPVWGIGLLVGQISILTKCGSKDDCLGYVVCCCKEES